MEHLVQNKWTISKLRIICVSESAEWLLISLLISQIGIKELCPVGNEVRPFPCLSSLIGLELEEWERKSTTDHNQHQAILKVQ